jgi:chorismate mutase
MSSFDLGHIAAHLEGLEETIISKLIDRAQFRTNIRVYQAGESGFDRESHRSLFEVRLLYQERMDARFGRFCVAEERPFNAKLPPPRRKVTLPATGLAVSNFNAVNLTADILPQYLALVNNCCVRGDDGHYGSSVEHDVYAIQAIARRIHYGAFYVAESKHRSDPASFDALAGKNDTESLLRKLTRPQVEERIIDRVREKVATAQANVNPAVRHVIDPDVVVSFYRETIIPLTKKGEVLYLLNRTGKRFTTQRKPRR